MIMLLGLENRFQENLRKTLRVSNAEASIPFPKMRYVLQKAENGPVQGIVSATTFPGSLSYATGLCTEIIVESSAMIVDSWKELPSLINPSSISMGLSTSVVQTSGA